LLQPIDKGVAVAKGILIEEFHLSVYAPRGLRDAEYDAIRQTLDDIRLHARLRRILQRVFRRYPSLNKARVRLSR
jgi:hypothetical protein